MGSKKVLIFDFDGTLINSGLSIYKILKKITVKFGNQNIDISDEDKFRDMSSREIVKGLFKNRFILYPLAPLTYLRFRYEYSKNIKELKPVPGIKEVLDELEKKGISMYIVSSSPKWNIKRFIREHDMEDFKLIEVVLGFFGKHIAIKRILKKEKLNPENVIYIGDETRDIESAHRAGVKSAAVTWGVNSKKVLEKYNPDYLITKPEELLLL